MLISCPSCTTRYDLSPRQIADNGSVVRCANCGHSWLEDCALDVIDISPVARPALAAPASSARAVTPLIEDVELDEDPIDVDIASRRIAAAAARAEREFTERRRTRRRKLAGWSGLAGAIAAGLAALYAFPDAVVRHAPGMAMAYEKLAVPFNRPEFEIRNVAQQQLVSDGTRVFALRGEVVNVSGKPLKVPALRFVMKDEKRREVYAWTLAGVASRELEPDQATPFVTRLAEPPETADEVEIRFAQANEMRSNAQP